MRPREQTERFDIRCVPMMSAFIPVGSRRAVTAKFSRLTSKLRYYVKITQIIFCFRLTYRVTYDIISLSLYYDKERKMKK